MHTSQSRNANSGQHAYSKDIPCRLVVLSLDQLYPHQSYVRHQLSVSASKLSALTELGEGAFQQPVMVTQKGTVIDGYARWELARRQGRQALLCLEYDLTDEESLCWLIRTHRPSKGFNGYCRTLLALDLEPALRSRARANQQIAGKQKASSDLTEAQKLDVRSEIAAVANVSTGNVTKAKQVVTHADPAIREATKSGEILVHKAWQFSCLSHHRQREKLEELRSCKGVGLVSRKLIQKHVSKMIHKQLIPETLNDVLKAFIPARISELDSIVVSEIDAPGRIAYFTKNAIGILNLKEDPECETANY